MPGRVPPPPYDDAVSEYRVETVPWDGHQHGNEHLQEALAAFDADGWDVVSVVPVRAGASARSILGGSGSADTTELAVVLRR